MSGPSASSAGAAATHRRGRRGGGGERPMVPPAQFTSYYGRPVVKPAPWRADIPAYLFLGGLAAGASMLGAGADLTGRAVLRRRARVAALAAIGTGYAALIHDLGRPERFVNMLRVAKPSSPMSVGTWILTAYSPLAGLAVAGELAASLPPSLGRVRRGLQAVGRPAGLGAALLGAGVASYTAVLLADTATPSWHEAHRELAFVFVGSSAAAAGGLGLVAVPIGENAPARRLALGGALLELVMEQRMEASMGIAAEPLHLGRPDRLLRASRALTVAGAAVAVAVGGKSRVAAVAAGAALLAGSACTRFGIFEAGQASARDPRYTIVPQRERRRARS